MRSTIRVAFLTAVAVVAVVGAVASHVRPAVAFPIPVPGTGAVSSSGYPSWGADIKVDIGATTTTAGTGGLTPGLYIISCTVATHVDQGVTLVTATTSERLIPAGAMYPLRVTGNADTHVAWIRNSSDGICVLSKEVF